MVQQKLTILLLMVALFISSATQAQKQITFDDVVTQGTFRAKSVYGLRSMKDGLHYTTLEDGGTKVVKYAYKTGKSVETVFDLKEMEDVSIERLSNYTFSDDESRLLLTTNPQAIYRHSFTAEYYIYNFVTKEFKELSTKGRQQLATFSPDGTRVAFVRENNIFIKSLLFGTEHQVTKDGKFNEIINGAPDWVYEEEFAFSKAFEWSPDSKKLAYMKFDEKEVPTFGFTMFKGQKPSLDQYAVYPDEYSYKYPKAGETNSVVSVYAYDLKAKQSIRMDVGEETDQYIPRIRWTHGGNDLGIFRMNRLQNKLEVLFANPHTGDTRVAFTEKNERYIGEDFLDAFTFLPDDKHIVVKSERDGYAHLYLFNKFGGKVKQITSGEFDVTEFYGYDASKKLFYYQAAAKTPMQREVYAVSWDGKKKVTIAGEEGTNSAVFSEGYKYYINYFSNLKTPTRVTLHDSKTRLVRTLEDNQELRDKMAEYTLPTKEFFQFTTSEGVSLNGYTIKPANFDASKTYPVLMTQYSGPNSQQVLNNFGISWYDYLAQEGYVVACVDPRGTGARGEEFRKCTYMQLGKLESDDQIEAAKYLGSLAYVDANNIAIWGWSYGGFMSSTCLGKAPEVFKAAISVAPVTNWRFYDSVYTERYMRTPQDNPEGYDENAPMRYAPNITGKLLLVHGTADDNVHYQNAAELAEVMIQSGVQFEMMSYTNRNHGIFGGNTRKHLYTMFTNFLNKNLK